MRPAGGADHGIEYEAERPAWSVTSVAART